MRRARIQMKPNIAKAAKQTPPVKAETLPGPPETVGNEEVLVDKSVLEPPSESMESLDLDAQKPLHVDTKPSETNHHVHFDDDVVDNEQPHSSSAPQPIDSEPVDSVLPSPTASDAGQFAVPYPPSRLTTPRSRNVSMCEDEAILTPRHQREKKRFTGKEELNTQTWTMADLTRWNPRNENTSYKRERRTSTSSTIITKSEAGDLDSQPATPRVNAPQVKIGADGRLVIDESSLVMQSAQINHESVWETVEEGRMSSKITSLSFRTRIFRKPSLWSERETDLFYEVLQSTGTDFGLMHSYLPQRSRTELKAKYNREEKQNLQRLLNVISHPVKLDSELGERITRIMAEIEEDVRSKKERHEYEKEEEKRVRAQMREQKTTERLEEQMKKAQARELVRQAKDLERSSRIAVKTNEKEAKARERTDAKELAKEAKRIANEAKTLIREARAREQEVRREAKAQLDQDNLEREAERIIRRLIQESQREERRADKGSRKKKKEKNAGNNEPSSSSSRPVRVSESTEPVDPHDASGPPLGDTTSDSSTTASSSDEEALKAKAMKREKERMKTMKRSLEPRATVIHKKPCYVDASDPKYAEPASKAVDIVRAASGSMFDSAHEEDEIAGPSSPFLRAPHGTPVGSEPETVDEPETQAEPVPKAVSDVIDELDKTRSKTPTMEVSSEPIESEQTEKPEEPVQVEESRKPDEPKTAEVPVQLEKSVEKPAEPSAQLDDSATKPEEQPEKLAKPETSDNANEKKKREMEAEEIGEPAAKIARVEERKGTPEEEDCVEDEDIIDVVTVDVSEPSTSSAPATVAAPLPPTPSKPSTSSASAASTSSPAPTAIPVRVITRTVKKPVFNNRKKK